MKLNLKKEKNSNKNFERKRKKKIYPFVIIFFLGFCILSYPFISQFYYRVESGKDINVFENEVRKLNTEDVLEKIRLAKAYNSTLDSSKLSDPYTDKEKKEGIIAYAKMLEVHAMIGHIEIPKIDEDIPIYAGTTEEVLQKGAGHLEGSSLPVGGESTHTVITAHRGLPTAKLFTKLDKLEIGDIFLIHNIETVLAYQVDNIITVEPTDFEPVLVKDGKDYATLLTCTPYMINSHRLLVRGHRIEYTPLEMAKVLKRRKTFFRRYFVYVLGITLFFTLLFVYIFRDYLMIKKKLKGLGLYE
ncbi:MAG: class C sortase [Peptoniphilaceae bacterium]|uniref:class C sortase n=1 Tax=Parvimonas sp. TaxID=1944660 RepID=UPI0025ED0DDC|nr:class C sortase [Parvimonas sp.]MCI5997989.1 class C sortase [Parvimonas sp.]MDD7764425.1 class C sortase [Peptoniphilaceae bacterium]MDY3051365.1 class C sortase [Parvimonas sp.]